ncbi:MAG: hypothetical protein ATN35_08785 [Epulopiscium sp. Nele67-Bin004]|nr:MAG: hypothetical protein ATN35_08785 [Epulopiscium sp. Nele67-Bin004]
MKRKLVATLLAMMLVSQPILASSTNIMINGEVISLPVSAVRQDGTTLIPVRAVAENLGCEVNWIGETKTVEIIKDNTVIILKIGSKTATVNGSQKTLDIAPFLDNGTTFLPVSVLAEALNLPLLWDSTTNTVLINSSTDDLTVAKNVTENSVESPFLQMWDEYATPIHIKFLKNSV